MTDPDNIGPPSDGHAEEPFEPTGKWANPAIYASNWKQILIVDWMIALAITHGGFLMILFWNWFIGSFVAAVGLVYLVALARRTLQWRWLRRRSGL